MCGLKSSKNRSKSEIAEYARVLKAIQAFCETHQLETVDETVRHMKDSGKWVVKVRAKDNRMMTYRLELLIHSVKMCEKICAKRMLGEHYMPYTAFTQKDGVTCFMYHSLGNVKDFVRSIITGQEKEKVLTHIFADLISAILDLNKIDCIHSRLKWENVEVVRDKVDINVYHGKLSAFEYVISRKDLPLEKLAPTQHQPPEMLINNPMKITNICRAQSFILGSMLLEILVDKHMSGVSFLPSKQDLKSRVAYENVLQNSARLQTLLKTTSISNRLQHTLTKMLQVDPTKRCCLQEALIELRGDPMYVHQQNVDTSHSLEIKLDNVSCEPMEIQLTGSAIDEGLVSVDGKVIEEDTETVTIKPLPKSSSDSSISTTEKPKPKHQKIKLSHLPVPKTTRNKTTFQTEGTPKMHKTSSVTISTSSSDDEEETTVVHRRTKVDKTKKLAQKPNAEAKKTPKMWNTLINTLSTPPSRDREVTTVTGVNKKKVTKKQTPETKRTSKKVKNPSITLSASPSIDDEEETTVDYRKTRVDDKKLTKKPTAEAKKTTKMPPTTLSTPPSKYREVTTVDNRKIDVDEKKFTKKPTAKKMKTVPTTVNTSPSIDEQETTVDYRKTRTDEEKKSKKKTTTEAKETNKKVKTLFVSSSTELEEMAVDHRKTEVDENKSTKKPAAETKKTTKKMKTVPNSLSKEPEVTTVDHTKRRKDQEREKIKTGSTKLPERDITVVVSDSENTNRSKLSKKEIVNTVELVGQLDKVLRQNSPDVSAPKEGDKDDLEQIRTRQFKVGSSTITLSEVPCPSASDYNLHIEIGSDSESD